VLFRDFWAMMEEGIAETNLGEKMGLKWLHVGRHMRNLSSQGRSRLSAG